MLKKNWSPKSKKAVHAEEFDLNISPDNQEVGVYMVQTLFANIQQIAKEHKAFKK